MQKRAASGHKELKLQSMIGAVLPKPMILRGISGSGKTTAAGALQKNSAELRGHFAKGRLTSGVRNGSRASLAHFTFAIREAAFRGDNSGGHLGFRMLGKQ